MPEVAPIVASDVKRLLHTPPLVVLERVVLPPVHTVSLPPIGDGLGLTVTTVVTEQPELPVNDMVAVPAAKPVKTPYGSIVPLIVSAATDHIPADGVSLSAVVLPEHTV